MTLLDLVGVIPDWMQDAACGADSGVDPELFFPHPGQNNEDDNRGTIAICRRCPVNKLCAQYALANNIEDGIWGGLTERKRRKLKRTREARSRIPVPERDCRRCGKPVLTRRGDFCGDDCRTEHQRAYFRSYRARRRSA